MATLFDGTLKTPFAYICAGATQSGKTTHAFNLLRYRHQLMDKPTDVVYYFYNHWQDPQFSEFEKLGIVTEWINEMPTLDLLMEKTSSHVKTGGCIVVIDDFMQDLNKDIAELFTVLSHANNISIILMTQNLFSPNPVFRTLSLNAKYIVIFKNPRDSSQIVNFAKQFAPGNTGYLIDAFMACTKRAHSYMLFDHDHHTPEHFRVRSDILPHEAPMKIWMPRDASI
jgi:hypothetical protein